jgi:hypothetical protein
MCHVPFVHPAHPGTVLSRESGLVPIDYELRETAGGCVVFTPPSTSESNEILVRLESNSACRHDPFLPSRRRRLFYMFSLSHRLRGFVSHGLMITDAGRRTPNASTGKAEGAVGDEDQAVLEAGAGLRILGEARSNAGGRCADADAA